jgi:hypothetical protein
VYSLKRIQMTQKEKFWKCEQVVWFTETDSLVLYSTRIVFVWYQKSQKWANIMMWTEESRIMFNFDRICPLMLFDTAICVCFCYIDLIAEPSQCYVCDNQQTSKCYSPSPQYCRRSRRLSSTNKFTCQTAEPNERCFVSFINNFVSVVKTNAFFRFR